MIDDDDAPVIHPSAIVESGASIGSGTRVWHHCHIRTGAVIGEQCTLGKNVFVDEGVVIGPRSKVQNNVSRVSRRHPRSRSVRRPECRLHQRSPASRVVNPGWETVPTVVRRGASIGANATVICGVELGEWCMVAAGSVVTRSAKAHQLVLGNPARHAGWVCACGELAAVATTSHRPRSSASCAGPAESVITAVLSSLSDRSVPDPGAHDVGWDRRDET